MTPEEASEIFRKFAEGMKLANKRLREKTKKENGELIIWRDGKIVRLQAKDL